MKCTVNRKIAILLQIMQGTARLSKISQKRSPSAYPALSGSFWPQRQAAKGFVQLGSLVVRRRHLAHPTWPRVRLLRSQAHPSQLLTCTGPGNVARHEIRSVLPVGTLATGPLRLQQPRLAIQPAGRDPPLLRQLPRLGPLVQLPELLLRVALQLGEVRLQGPTARDDVVWVGSVAGL